MENGKWKIVLNIFDVVFVYSPRPLMGEGGTECRVRVDIMN